jgi:hypothetical protein
VAVDDSLWLSRAGLGIVHSDRWCVSATRRVTAVYEVTGDAEAQLAALAAAAKSVNWDTARSAHVSIRAEGQQSAPVDHAPAYLRRQPGCRLYEPPPVATPFHYPVERTQPGVAAITERALAWAGQVIKVTVSVTYYER